MLNWLRGERNQVEELSVQLAAQAREQVWQRIAAKIRDMSAAEARGYTRARAALIVARAADAVFRQQPRTVSSKVRERVVAAAMHSVVGWAVQRRHESRTLRHAA